MAVVFYFNFLECISNDFLNNCYCNGDTTHGSPLNFVALPPIFMIFNENDEGMPQTVTADPVNNFLLFLISLSQWLQRLFSQRPATY